MPERVRITDVAPRDGLQNEAGLVPTEQKAALVRALAGCGLDEVEVTSFVSPKWVPQLGDAAELCDMLAQDKPEGVVYSALVPNERGMAGVLAANERAGFRLIDKVGIFTAASESFSQKNTNATIAETIERFRPVVRLAHEQGIAVRGYVSCVIACPFEGVIEPLAVAAVAGQLVALGVEEIDLGDTIGAGTGETIGRMLATVLEALEGHRGSRWHGSPSCADGGSRGHGSPNRADKEKQDGPDAKKTHGSESRATGSRATGSRSIGSEPSRVMLHLHDTHGRAAEGVRVALELGVRSFDGAVAGLGGCPYAGTAEARAPGNIATSVLLDEVERCGYRHGVDRSKLAVAAQRAVQLIGSGTGTDE